MKALGVVFACVLGLIGVLGLTWLIQGNEFFLNKVFAPANERVRRETFEQSKAYRDGMIQELQNMQFEYEKADEKHKDALASIILHRAAAFPEDGEMPADLKRFLSKLRSSIIEGGK